MLAEPTETTQHNNSEMSPAHTAHAASQKPLIQRILHTFFSAFSRAMSAGVRGGEADNAAAGNRSLTEMGEPAVAAGAAAARRAGRSELTLFSCACASRS